MNQFCSYPSVFRNSYNDPNQRCPLEEMEEMCHVRESSIPDVVEYFNQKQILVEEGKELSVNNVSLD